MGLLERPDLDLRRRSQERVVGPDVELDLLRADAGDGAIHGLRPMGRGA